MMSIKSVDNTSKYLNMHIMTQDESIKYIREFVFKGLKISMYKTEPVEIQAAAFAFQNAISQIPDHIIYELIKQPNLRLRIQKLKPQTDEHTNASNKANRRRHTP